MKRYFMAATGLVLSASVQAEDARPDYAPILFQNEDVRIVHQKSMEFDGTPLSNIATNFAIQCADKKAAEFLKGTDTLLEKDLNAGGKEGFAYVLTITTSQQSHKETYDALTSASLTDLYWPKVEMGTISEDASLRTARSIVQYKEILKDRAEGAVPVMGTDVRDPRLIKALVREAAEVCAPKF